MSRALPILLAVAAAPLLATCQQYEFEEVVPKAIGAVTDERPIEGKKSFPKIMLVVDASGSMKSTDSASAPYYCTSLPNDYENGIWEPYDSTSTVACKWNVMKKAFADPDTGFLATTKDKALFGLTVFPDRAAGADSCAAGKVEVEMGTQLGDNVAAITSRLEAIKPSGGTPSTTTLDAVLGNDAFMAKVDGQDRFVLLLTDGQPNCNSANQSKCQTCFDFPDQCFGVNACYPSQSAESVFQCKADPNQYINCWDGPNLATAVKTLFQRGVKTYVIGFGASTATSDASAVLKAAALEGGTGSYYQANNLGELEKVLGEISDSLQTCTFGINPAPSQDNPNLLLVELKDSVEGTTHKLEFGVDWSYKAGSAGSGSVEILNGANGDWCNKLQIPNRYVISFRYASDL